MVAEPSKKNPERIKLGPQPGPQEVFLSTPADIAIFGGGAGGGKTFALLLEPIRHISNPRFGAVIFRRTYNEIAAEGGLWDASGEIYPHVGGIPKESAVEWSFGKGKAAKVKFAHMQHEKDRHQWDGSEIPLICFDQLEHFSWKSFSYMLSRNRSTCGVRPYIRATCNPHPDHWLRWFLDWWIDRASGLPIHDRSGVVRWFVSINNETIWADTADELTARYGQDVQPKSCTFIHASVYDNRALLSKDPGYLANLKAMPLVERERLLGGNWNVRETAGSVFKREWFEIVDAAPSCAEEIRYWDRAATDESSPNAKTASWTAGVLMGRDRNGIIWIKDVRRFQGTPHKVMQTIKNIASQDGKSIIVGIEQDPGQAGKAEAEAQVRNLQGFIARINTVRESKGARAMPLSAQAEAGNVKIVRGPWNEPFLRELDNFSAIEKCAADQVDAASGAFYMLTNRPPVGVPSGDVSQYIVKSDQKHEVTAADNFTFDGGWA